MIEWCKAALNYFKSQKINNQDHKFWISFLKNLYQQLHLQSHFKTSDKSFINSELNQLRVRVQELDFKKRQTTHSLNILTITASKSKHTQSAHLQFIHQPQTIKVTFIQSLSFENFCKKVALTLHFKHLKSLRNNLETLFQKTVLNDSDIITTA